MNLNCIIIDDETHAIAGIEEMISQTSGLSLMNSFANTKDALEFLKRKGKIDIVFSDIHMPGINGIDSASFLVEYCNFLVYITGYREYAVDAFAVHADGYLLKPVNLSQFKMLVTHLSSKKSQISDIDMAKDVFWVKGGQKHSTVKIKYTDVIYVEGLLNYVNIYTRDKGVTTTYLSLKGMETKLNMNNLFFRVNKSNIISSAFITKVSDFKVYLTNGKIFPIGEKYRTAFFDFLKTHHINQ